MSERDFAEMECARNAFVDAYFKARPQLMRTTHEERLVEAGFTAAWNTRAPVAAVQGEAVAWQCQISVDGTWATVNSKALADHAASAGCEVRPLYTAPAVAGVPEGYAVVPVEPTTEQISAAREETDRQFDTYGERPYHDDIYRVMVKAAPSAPSAAHEADKRIAALESQLAESMEREAKLIADLDANLDAYSDERKRALSAENLARELHDLLADYVSQDSIAQGYGSGVGGTTYQKAEAFLDALAAEKEGE